MSQVERKAWHCDVCGFEWLAAPAIIPLQCPSSKCRSRRWNANDVALTYGAQGGHETRQRSGPSEPISKSERKRKNVLQDKPMMEGVEGLNLRVPRPLARVAAFKSFFKNPSKGKIVPKK